jgi:uncharacterized protein
MELIADRGRRVAIEELNTSRLLAHARKQAQQRHLDDVLIVDVDTHHYDAETQLLYASDYPHWDFDLPSRIWDLPFLSEKARHNILGGTAARLFKLPPRNEKQRENLRRLGNVAA